MNIYLITFAALSLTTSCNMSEQTTNSRPSSSRSDIINPSLKAGKSGASILELAQLIKKETATLSLAKDQAASASRGQLTALGLDKVEDPVESRVREGVNRLNAAADAVSKRAQRMNELERNFLVTNSDGATELQGMSEIRKKLETQLQDIANGSLDSISDSSSKASDFDSLKDSMAKTTSMANAQKDDLVRTKTSVAVPFKNLKTFVESNHKALSFNAEKDRVDYVNADMLMQVVLDLSRQIEGIQSQTPSFQTDLSAFDMLATDMDSLSENAVTLRAQVAKVRETIEARQSSGSLGYGESRKNVDGLKATQKEIKNSVLAFRATITEYQTILKSLKENDLVTMVAEIHRLIGAADTLSYLANQESDAEIKSKFLGVRATIMGVVKNLGNIQLNLDGKITEANAIAQEQSDVAGNQDIIQDKQAEILRQFDEMIAEQSEKLKKHEDIVALISNTLKDVDSIMATHANASSEIRKLKGEFAEFQIEFTNEIREAQALIEKARMNIVTANLTRSWTNPFNRLDVNFDGHVNAIDALVIINALNSSRYTSKLKADERPADAPFLDVDGNLYINSIDPLTIINHLNRKAQALK
jgi:hypothetical protein